MDEPRVPSCEPLAFPGNDDSDTDEGTRGWVQYLDGRVPMMGVGKDMIHMLVSQWKRQRTRLTVPMSWVVDVISCCQGMHIAGCKCYQALDLAVCQYYIINSFDHLQRRLHTDTPTFQPYSTHVVTSPQLS